MSPEVDAQLESAKSRVGEALNDKWTLLRLLAVGGMSAVYEAQHRNGRRAAVKLLAPGVAQTLAAHESRLANAVDHPGVVTILDDDVAEDGTAYLVMELLDGETLESRRSAAGGALSLEDAFSIFEGVLEVLAVAHDRGVIHRDIKPENVFLPRDGGLKVLDFGLAAGASNDEKDGHWFGTPGFMPPEQARGSTTEVDARSDLWSAAATLFTVLTGRLVHESDTCEGIVVSTALRDVDVEPLEEVAPVEIVDVIARALAFDRMDRWPNARAMLNAFRSARRRVRTLRPISVVRLRSAPVAQTSYQSETRLFRWEEATRSIAL